MTDLREFWKRLSQGPAVLFLGQDYLSLESGEDPLLGEIGSKFGGHPTNPAYHQLLDGSASESGQSALGWLSERCRRMSPPSWLESVSNFPWNSVFSSAIDPIWLSAFRGESREVAPVFDDDYFPRDPRNRQVLHATFLFGAINQSEPNQRSPLSQFEFLGRQLIARNLAQRLPDTVTPLGVLVIEGYRGNRDWFQLADLYPILQSFGPGQVHVFSVDQELENDPILSELVRTETVVVHSEGLAWALQRGIDQGFVQLGALLSIKDGTRRITLRHGPVPISREIWNRIGNSGTLIDDSILAPPSPISKEALYWEFRRFLFESGIRPLWSGYARELAFRREFERELYEKVTARLSKELPIDQPIIVHGQTGTGKTVALGNLAYTLAKSGTYPVIFIERKTQRPIDTDIDECCRWLENHGAEATLIVWDGMVQQGDYYELQGYLASRGRKAIVVGSSYKLSSADDHLVEVPDQLSASEAIHFADFLENLGIRLTESHRHDLERRDPSYLVALYRHLASARPSISRGVVQELEQLESLLIEAVHRFQPEGNSFGALAAAFLAAGLVDPNQVESTGLRADTQVSAAKVGELVDIITVPGRFGLNIPVELLARTWNQPDFVYIAQILQGCDIFRVIEDAAGRLVVGPRHPLEASLVVEARVGSVAGEVEVISNIVKSMRSSTWGASESDEISFVIELIREAGPQSSQRSRFAPHFRTFADAITEARELRRIQSPRLMLQEANLLREWITNRSQQGSRPEETAEVLEQAQLILEGASDLLKDNPHQWRLRSFIATELASTFGAATIDSIRTEGGDGLVRSNYRQVLNAVRLARSIDSSSYSPVDVLVWSTTALAQQSNVEETTLTEAIVDVLDALETIDPELLDVRNREQFHRRRLEVGQLLGDEGLSESAFEELLSIGSSAGFYIRAREIAQAAEILDDGKVRDIRPYSDAWAYLENNRAQIAKDPRCLNLMLNYWWLSKTRHRLFHDERVVLSFQKDEWNYALRIVRELKAFDSNRGLTLSLLEAVSLFHLDLFPAALQVFGEVEAESYRVPGRRRILRSFLASESDGVPRVFHGTVQSVDSRRNRAQVFVEEIGRYITFLPTDFGRPDIRQGDSLGQFHIAFNFIGPIADPLARYSA